MKNIKKFAYPTDIERKFTPEFLNPHYDWENKKNRATIKAVHNYDRAFINKDLPTLEKFEEKALEGKNSYKTGVKINSPWGNNIVLSAQTNNGIDTVVKEITVKSGFMLSLQRHRGRTEVWKVAKGTLTVISDGKRHEIPTGKSITIPKDNIHCMINLCRTPVTIIETKTGFCREADNVRLLDFNNRPTVPLTNRTEALSAILYTEIHEEIRQQFGCAHPPNSTLMAEEFKQEIIKLR